MVYSGKDQWGEDKLERLLDDIDKSCEKHPWFRDLDRGYMME